LLLLEPEKLLLPEFMEFQIDWASINASWIQVDNSSGTFNHHFIFSREFLYVCLQILLVEGHEEVTFLPLDVRKQDANFFPTQCWGTILASMDQDEMDILSDQVIKIYHLMCLKRANLP